MTNVTVPTISFVVNLYTYTRDRVADFISREDLVLIIKEVQ